MRMRVAQGFLCLSNGKHHQEGKIDLETSLNDTLLAPDCESEVSDDSDCDEEIEISIGVSSSLLKEDSI